MADVPSSPAEFFTKYVPSRFETVKASVAGKSSPGSMTFRVRGKGEWSLRLANGELQVKDGSADDVVLQITIDEKDFETIFVSGAKLQEGSPPDASRQIFAFKALTIDEGRAKLVRGIPGSMAFVVKEDGAERKVVITPGAQQPKFDEPDCKLECTMADFHDMQTGKQLPVQLFMSGRIRMIGNAQIPMALSGVLG